MVAPFFEFTNKDVAFVWNLDYQRAFEALKRALVNVLVVVPLNFKKPFCLHVD